MIYKRSVAPKSFFNSIDKFISSNIETTSTSDALQLEPSVARKVEQVCASPATSNVTHKKDLNASQSMLSGLVDLPIEIFAEIASLAQPGDLLSLARCCKPLREMLMRPWVAYIWRSAENNVEELPHCPEDMCEPQYAALLFTNFCTSCGEKTSSQADPNLRVRLCSECCATKFVFRVTGKTISFDTPTD
ncbi:hypothetical protein BDV93DRAFT_194002 [Ceratobasidium sp. AG-I]|nr:hypothetical protein BDV93DRAFT_194002 [Ceratobasidium sp. AG-I]